MAQAWHKSRVQLSVGQEAEGSYWKANKHRHNSNKYDLYPVTERGEEERTLFFSVGPDVNVEVTPDAVWGRFNLFDSYRPPSSSRQTDEAGPHLEFLSLKGTLQK